MTNEIESEEKPQANAESKAKRSATPRKPKVDAEGLRRDEAREVVLPKPRIGDWGFLRDGNDNSILPALVVAVEAKGLLAVEYHKLSLLGRPGNRRGVAVGLGKWNFWPNLDELESAVKIERSGILFS